MSAEDDTELFRRAVEGARRLNSERVRRDARRPVPQARFAREDRDRVLEESLSGAPVEAGDETSFHRPQVSRRLLLRLRRGEYSIAAEIDLHGLTAAEARIALAAFLQDSAARGLACVRVVHGKGRRSGHGGPVLKRSVDTWLRQRDEVLAFASARSVDGGTGALYVLLRVSRQGKWGHS
ncbi:MAG: Smr/MutS family protein [Gammaproteobacteria bacterium]|nr:Smr/MutS family protein [Gammaproteobacteria bacterium]